MRRYTGETLLKTPSPGLLSLNPHFMEVNRKRSDLLGLFFGLGKGSVKSISLTSGLYNSQNGFLLWVNYRL